MLIPPKEKKRCKNLGGKRTNNFLRPDFLQNVTLNFRVGRWTKSSLCMSIMAGLVRGLGNHGVKFEVPLNVSSFKCRLITTLMGCSNPPIHTLCL